MNISTELVGVTVLIGAGATLFMDLWALLLKTAFSVALPNYCLIGRWIRHMPAGRFRHPNIATASGMPAECLTGWVFHYLVGIAYALLLVQFTGARWLEHPTLLPALATGIGTVVVPFFLMQPAFGLGMAAAKTPNPAQARLKSLMSHTVFGVGLYLAGVILR